jgi:hypothetical protein
MFSRREVSKKMKKLFSTIVISLLVAVFSVASISYAAEADPDLVKVIVGEWQYYSATTTTKRGTMTFDSAESGTVLDEKFGEGSFTGKFVDKAKYEAQLTFPKDPKVKDQTFVTTLKFKKRFNKWGFNGKAKSEKKSFKLSNAIKVERK